jgi:hypothetical protein
VIFILNPKHLLDETNMTLLQELDKSQAQKEFFQALKKWVVATDGQPIFRGIGAATIDNPNRTKQISIDDLEEIEVLEIETRKDRNPKDSSLQLHKLLDKWLFDETGIKFRSEGVFAAKSTDIATRYGDAYVIVPKGNVHYCWSPYIDDAYLLFNENESGQELTDLLHNRSARKILDPIAKEMGIAQSDIKDFIDELLKPKKFGVKKAISILSKFPNIWVFDKDLVQCPEQNEIMIVCDSYYLVGLADYEYLVKFL